MKKIKIDFRKEKRCVVIYMMLYTTYLYSLIYFFDARIFFLFLAQTSWFSSNSVLLILLLAILARSLTIGLLLFRSSLSTLIFLLLFLRRFIHLSYLLIYSTIHFIPFIPTKRKHGDITHDLLLYFRLFIRLPLETYCVPDM